MSSTSRHRALPVTLAALVALCAACHRDGGSPTRPNVIVVCVDTLRADRLSCYGHPRPTSPWLDARAAEGTLFEDVTAQAGWTLPSMVSLFTSRYLTAYSEAIPPSAASLPEVFRSAGYRTAAVVANLSVNQLAGFDRGFDVYDLRAEEPLPGDTGDRPRTIDRMREHLAEALDQLTEQRGADAPLFLLFFPFDPHDPYYKQPHLDAELPPLEADSPIEWHRAQLADHPAPAPEVDPDWEQHLAHIAKQRGFYDQEVRHTDDVLAQVFDDLEARGLLEHSVVAFVSDHGEGLWEHRALQPADVLAQATPLKLFYQKHGAHLFEEATATPLVLWGTGVAAGRRITQPVENIDLFPTLLELAGLSRPPDLHGRSLVPLWGADPPPWRETVHSFLYHEIAVREVATGLKLIAPTDVEKRVEPEPRLHHLPSDPDERHNLYTQRPDDVTRLEGRLREWLERHPTPAGWEIQRSEGEQLEILRALGYTDEDLGERTHRD